MAGKDTLADLVTRRGARLLDAPNALVAVLDRKGKGSLRSWRQELVGRGFATVDEHLGPGADQRRHRPDEHLVLGWLANERWPQLGLADAREPDCPRLGRAHGVPVYDRGGGEHAGSAAARHARRAPR